MDDPFINDKFHELREQIRKHEEEDHGGERCADERTNLVACLAHMLRLTTEDWKQVLHIWVKYEEGHRATTRD